MQITMQYSGQQFHLSLKFFSLFFLLTGFHSKTEQPLRGMELPEKKLKALTKKPIDKRSPLILRL